MPTEYRPCVVAVFTNSSGNVLVCERGDKKGAWQFPQGGIEPGESALNALYREMLEEIGCDSFRVKYEGSGLVKYQFPEGMKSSIAKKWIGQSQTWFHAVFDKGEGPDISKGDGEFVSVAWKPVTEVVSGIVEWKRDAYIEGLKKLKLLDVD